MWIIKINKGFSVIELIIVVAFLGLIGASAVFFLRNQFLGTLESDSQTIKARLQETQIRAISGLEGKQWGIHFDNNATPPFYALFPGASYSTASSTYFLSNLVEFQTPGAGATKDIIFNKLSGATTATDSVIIRLKNNTSQIKTITVSAQGKISVE